MDISNDESVHFFRKLNVNLLNIVLIGVVIYLGKGIILPILFSALLATLLLPAVNYLRSKKFSQSISIILPLVMSLLTIGGILYFLSTQIAHFFDDWDSLKDRANDLIRSLQKWVSENLNIARRDQAEYLNETAEKVKTAAPKIAGKTFLSLTESFSYIVLLPIYTFLILYYKSTIRKFLIELFQKSSQKKVIDTLHSCSRVAQRYITGLLIETSLVFTLNTIGFLILGIKYAIFLALLAALLNIIPYIGMIVANIFCMLITLMTSENPTQALWVAAILALVQFFDNNIGMPLIVGNSVRINALVTIVGVLIGGALCGVPGMFLAIPTLAVLKVIFDRVEGLHPWATLLGDETQQGRDEKGLKFIRKKNKGNGETKN
ncbi:MAG TPA: AI-2E family transporter [Cyclobacteriaceae bacterium]|nr:AI-2E family transporter [Cyclobacteriaceae bacterium]